MLSTICKALLILFVLAGLCSCSKQEQPDKAQKGITIDQLVDKDGVVYKKDASRPYTGRAYDLWSGGTLKEERFYKRGHLNGVYTWYYENGEKSRQLNYLNGVKSGKETTWFQGGVLAGETPWKDDKENGRAVKYYENGQKKWEIIYQNGAEQQTARYWYDDGRKRMEVDYKDGKENGLRREWDPTGKLIKEEKWINGNQQK